MSARLRFLSVCSGIEAASVAWKPLGWKALAFSEIEQFPRAVLAHHYPDVPLHGDFTKLRDEPWIVSADILAGGTPCQAFSIAGLRNSLADERGNLTLEFVRLLDAIDDLRLSAGREPAVCFWENVPGVLSTRDNAFGCFLAALVGEDAPLVPGRGQKWTDAGLVVGPRRAAAWRTLDAQYFGLAQRRRRVFVVASARDGFDPAEVLFERQGVQGNPAPRREAGEGFAGGSGLGSERVRDLDIAHALRAEGFDASEDGTGRGTPLVPVAFSCKDHGADAADDLAPTLRSMGHDGSHANGGGQLAVAFNWQGGGTQTTLGYDPDAETTGTLTSDQTPAVAFALRGREEGAVPEVNGDGQSVGTLRAAGGGSSRDYIAFQTRGSNIDLGQDVTGTLGTNCDQASGSAPMIATSAVRRLTPRECERLQGFPDDYTLIPYRGRSADECPDGPRYKALGNSWAVPVVRWIGVRLDAHLAALAPSHAHQEGAAA